MIIKIWDCKTARAEENFSSYTTIQLIPSNRLYIARIFHIQLFRERLSEKVHATIPKGIAYSCARGTFLTCIPSLLVALPPNQYSTSTLMQPATQATKGTVDGFESTVLQRNLKEWPERPWTYICYCWRKTTKVGSTASVSGTVYLSYPYYLSGFSRARFFFRQPFTK